MPAIEKTLTRLKGLLESKGRKILIYHSDADGVCSAALITRFFPGFEAIPREGPLMEAEFTRGLIEKKPDVLMFVDIPADQEYKTLETIQERTGCSLVLIDHHIPEKDMNSPKTIHINPKLEKGKDVYIPASCVVYRMLDRLSLDPKNDVWISMVGIIGDYGGKDCTDVIGQCRKTFPGSIGKDHLRDRSELKTITDMISSQITLHGLKGASESLEVMRKAGDYRDFLNNRSLSSGLKKVNREITRVMKDFVKNRERRQEIRLTMYEIKSRMNITSVIATIASEKYPNDVIILRKQSEKGWKLSLRCQSGRVSVGELAKKCTQGIGSGGGHVKSGGALIRDWETFRQRVLRELGK